MMIFLVTGASRGLGRHIAEKVLAAGHSLLATARNPEQLADLAERHGDQVRTMRLDVTDPTAAQLAVDTAVKTFGRLDVVVNNAGYANSASVEDMTGEDFRAQLDTNLLGVVNVTMAALPVLRTQGSGHIIQVSSVGGRVTTPGLSAYQAAKFAVGGFSEVLAQEVAPLGIKVTVLEPGGMSTDWAGSSMTVHPVSPPYEQTVGRINTMRTTLMARAVSDPAKVADAVLTIAGHDNPPIRLLLGSDAIRAAARVAAARAESDAEWHALSTSTDRDDVTEADLDPLATTKN